MLPLTEIAKYRVIIGITLGGVNYVAKDRVVVTINGIDDVGATLSTWDVSIYDDAPGGPGRTQRLVRVLGPLSPRDTFLVEDAQLNLGDAKSALMSVPAEAIVEARKRGSSKDEVLDAGNDAILSAGVGSWIDPGVFDGKEPTPL